MAGREVTVRTWVALVVPAVASLLGALIGVGGSVVLNERDADRELERRVVDRRIAAYAEYSQAVNNLLADYRQNSIALGFEDASPEAEELAALLGTPTPAELAAVLEEDENDVRSARARLDIVGTARASEAADDIELMLVHLVGRVKVFAIPEIPEGPPPTFTAEDVRRAFDDVTLGYFDFIVIARDDTRE